MLVSQALLDLKKLRYAVSKESFNYTKYNTLNARVHELEKFLMYLLWLRKVNTRQINKIWWKKLRKLRKKILDVNGLATIAAVNT